jgi:hypothetical protein
VQFAHRQLPFTERERVQHDRGYQATGSFGRLAFGFAWQTYAKEQLSNSSEANTIFAALAELGSARQVNVPNERIQNTAQSKPVC